MDRVPNPDRREDRPRRTGCWARRVALAIGIASGPALAGEPSGPEPERPGVAAKAQVASAPPDASGPRRVLDAAPAPRHAAPHEADPIARARLMIAESRARYQAVSDYTCTFFKRERVDGKLYDAHVLAMKARTRPSSVYFKFIKPYSGREAIFVQGRNNNKIVAHEVGFGRVVAGTMHLDPKGDMAMEDNRHPVTEAGIGALIDTIQQRWNMDLTPANSRISFHPQARVGDRACTMIETIHPHPGPQFLFYQVKLYIDKELGLPIRFEAYDWPTRPGQEPPLMEEYTYMNLRLNVGLKDRDFDHNNAQYSFGRF